MFNNTIIAGAMFLAFGYTGITAPTGPWIALGVLAILLDVVQLLTKSTKIVLPVVGLADLSKTGGQELGGYAQAGGMPLGMPTGEAPCKCGKPGCPSIAVPQQTSACAGGHTALYEDKSYL